MRVSFATLIASLLLSLPLHAAWSPPEDPDPQAILAKARVDAKEGRFEDALAKHVWFHKHALELRPSLQGVRLSFALSDWRMLGFAYPPAIDALKKVRDEAEQDVRGGRNAPGAFRDLAAIDGYLGDAAHAADLYAWLDANRPGEARELAGIAQRSLIAAGRYELAGKYLVAETAVLEIRKRRLRDMDLARDQNLPPDLARFAAQRFTNDAATTVAVLAKTGRGAEADTAMAQFEAEWADEDFRKALREARAGKMPPPWPPLAP